MKNKMLIVLKHEFMQKVKSKGFIVLTVLTPLLMSLTVLIPLFVNTITDDDERHITIIDESGKIGDVMLASHDSTSKVRFSIITQDEANQNTLDSLKLMIGQKKLEGYLRIPSDIVENISSKAILGVRNSSNFSSLTVIRDQFQKHLTNERLRVNGIDPLLLDSLTAPSSLEVLKVTENKEAKDNGIGFAAGYVTGILLYLSLLIYGSLIMQSVIEEKSTRVVELLVSSVTPKQLLMGKIFGVCLAGMLQIVVWAFMIAAFSFFILPTLAASIGPSISTVLTPLSFIYFILYFVCGFLIYATLYATAGAMVEQTSDAQGAAMPITLLVVLSIMMMSSVIQSPSSTASVILSLIPFFSPILMMGRIFSETPPFWQIALSFILMGATFYIISSGAGKIYRTGILMYGKKFTFREVFKWLKYS